MQAVDCLAYKLQDVISFAPPFVSAKHSMMQCRSAGTKLKGAGKSHEALQKYQEAVKICPDYAAGFYDLGVYYTENNQVRTLP